MNTSSQFRIMMNDVCGKSDAINLSFGDGVYHPFMEILGMIYFWGFHNLPHIVIFPSSKSFSGAGPSATAVPWIPSGNGSPAERMMPLSA